MLNRQRVLITLLAELGRPVSHTHLVKFVFLLRQGTEVSGDRTFYDFVPYKYGPFSFALYRELAALERHGYVYSSRTRFGLQSATADLQQEEIKRLSSSLREAIRALLSRYGQMSQDALLKHVYTEFPWFASRSERADLAPVEVPKVEPAPIAVYTAGYEGRSVDAFFNSLLEAGIQAILDVRSNPISRKYGFAKKSLRDIAEKMGLGYHHLPELGISSSERASLTDFPSYQRLLNRYRDEYLPSRKKALARLLGLVKAEPSVLLCAEKDIRCCHRGPLSSAVAAESGLAVVHL